MKLSYSLVRQILQGARLLKKGRARGRHRMKREGKACLGEMLHIDGSLHEWLALVPGAKQTLIQVVNDATSRLLYAQLWASESSQAIMTALRGVMVGDPDFGLLGPGELALRDAEGGRQGGQGPFDAGRRGPGPAGG